MSGVAYALDLPSWAGPPAVVLIMTAAAWVGLHRRVRGPLRVANAWVERRVDGDVNARLPVTSGDEAGKLASSINDLIAAAFHGEAHIHSILRTAADGIVTIDELGVVELSNPAAERMFGVESGALTGVLSASCCPPTSACRSPAWVLTPADNPATTTSSTRSMLDLRAIHGPRVSPAVAGTAPRSARRIS